MPLLDECESERLKKYSRWENCGKLKTWFLNVKKN